MEFNKISLLKQLFLKIIFCISILENDWILCFKQVLITWMLLEDYFMQRNKSWKKLVAKAQIQIHKSKTWERHKIVLSRDSHLWKLAHVALHATKF